MKALGVALVVIGIVALLYGGISYKREKTAIDLGPLEVKTTERKSIPLPPVIGVIALVGGIGLLVSKR